jgi:ABC-2 type transport system ATP-binding protein
MSNPVIDCQKLSKRYGKSDTYALKDLTLQVQPGEIYGFLGPNGAGKSTTIRTLMNFIQPSGGSATILGRDVVADSVAIKRHVGYLSGEFNVYKKLTGDQFLDYMEELQPAKSQAYRKDLGKRLRADLHKPLKDLSRGNRQKIGIIQAFMHQPDILILDEATSGLDPLMQEVFYDLMHESTARGAAIFASSHILGEVQKMCDRVGIIKDGRLIAERDIGDMATDAAQTFDISFADQPPLAALKKIKGLRVSNHDDHSVTLHIQGDLTPLFQLLAKHSVTQLDTRQLDLEEVFLHFYESETAAS